jgi:peptidyl-tRNA hydrolase
LSPFASEERPAAADAVVRAAEAVRTIITDGLRTAMNKFNRKE